MTIRVIREPSLNATTLSVVMVDDRFFSFGLEDAIREVSGKPVASWKVPGETAIPAGRYRLAMTYSPKFQRVMPEVLDVPGFDGIRIHAGNSQADTQGCLLLGVQRAGARVIDSVKACAMLTTFIEAAEKRGDATWILFENPMGYAAWKDGKVERGDVLRTAWGEERIVERVTGAHDLVSSSAFSWKRDERSAVHVNPDLERMQAQQAPGAQR